MTFAEFCRSLSILPPEAIERGRWVRCPTVAKPRKKNAGIKLSEDGKTGFAFDHSSMTEAAIWRDGIDGPERTAEQRNQDNAELSARISAKRLEERKATARAKAEYDRSAGILGAQHSYLIRKRILALGTMGLRVNAGGELIVPMYRDGKLVSIQRISATGVKKFATGAPSKNAVFWITRPKACVTIICEGWATGATLFESLPTSKVCVCFSAGNLVSVAEREEWSGLVAVAADNDHDTQENTGKNPGIEAATKAAKLIGCGVAIPENIDGSDFNDSFVLNLEKLESKHEFTPHKPSPHKLRASALAPISAALMRAATMVRVST